MQAKSNLLIKHRTSYLKDLEESNISCIEGIQSNYYSRLFKGKRHSLEKVAKVLPTYKIVELNEWKFTNIKNSSISTNTMFESYDRTNNINYLEGK